MDVPHPKTCCSSTLSKGVCCKLHRCWGTWLEPGAFLQHQGSLACFHPVLGCCTSLQGLLGRLKEMWSAAIQGAEALVLMHNCRAALPALLLVAVLRRSKKKEKKAVFSGNRSAT